MKEFMSISGKVELEDETYVKIILLEFNLWESAIQNGWYFTGKFNHLIEGVVEVEGNGTYKTPQEAALAGIKYYTAGNKP